MKKLLLSLSALIMLGLSNISAQLINPDFTTWTTDAVNGSAMDPNSGIGNSGWWDFNFDGSVLFGSSPVTVFKGTVNPCPVGNDYAQIVSAPMTASTYTTLTTYASFNDTNALLFTAYINYSGGLVFKSGEPWTDGRSPSISFYYKYKPNGIDTASCTVAMYHFNTVNHTRELIGGGLWTTHVAASVWTLTTVPILYDSATSIPDTIYVQFSACSVYAHGKPKDHDTLDIGGTSQVLGLGNVAEQNDNVNLYPNPANTEINLAVSGQFEASRVEVYDMTGRAIGTYSMNNNFLTINIQSYKSGMYFYKLLDNTGSQLNVGKFSVVK